MNRTMRKSELSAERQQLVELMQYLNFGTIERLVVRDGEPFLQDQPRVVRDIKLGGDNGPRPERRVADFALKPQVSQLFEELDALRCGEVLRIEVKHGLPFLMRVAIAE